MLSDRVNIDLEIDLISITSLEVRYRELRQTSLAQRDAKSVQMCSRHRNVV